MHDINAEPAQKIAQIRITARTANGLKTCICMPEAQYTNFLTLCGSKKAFRGIFNTAVKESEPRPGYSRSQQVRMKLEEQIK